MHLLGFSAQLVARGSLLEFGLFRVLSPHVLHIGRVLGVLISEWRKLLIKSLHRSLDVVLLADLMYESL